MAQGRNPQDLLEEMLEELTFLEEHIVPMEVDAFLEDPSKQRAAAQSLAILGEAAKAIPEEVREAHPEVPWGDMAQMRDILVHAYHRVEPRIVYETVTEDAVPLRTQLSAVLRDVEPED